MLKQFLKVHFNKLTESSSSFTALALQETRDPPKTWPFFPADRVSRRADGCLYLFHVLHRQSCDIESVMAYRIVSFLGRH